MYDNEQTLLSKLLLPKKDFLSSANTFSIQQADLYKFQNQKFSTNLSCKEETVQILGVFVAILQELTFCPFHSNSDGKILLANNVDPDQTPHYVASDLSLHCLLLQVSR